MAIGDIGTIVDTLEFDIARARVPDVIRVATGIYAVVYCGPGDDGWLKTFNVDTAGNIGAVRDSFKYCPNISSIGIVVPAKIRHVSGDIYAIAYRDRVNDEGRIVTVEIDSLGNITQPVIDGPNIFTNNMNDQDIGFVKIATGMFACAWSDGPGRVCSIGINDAGIIDGAITDSLVFEGVFSSDITMLKVVGSDFVAIAYREGMVPTPLQLITVQITSAGVIPAAITDILEIGPSNISSPEPTICHVSGDIYAVVFRDNGGFGHIITVDIDSLGNIAVAVTDSVVFETTAAFHPDIVFIFGGIYALAYRGGPTSNFALQVATIDISDLGNIGAAVLDRYQFYNNVGVYGGNPRIFVVTTGEHGVLGIVHTDLGEDGKVVTIGEVVTGASPTVQTNPATEVLA